MRVDWIIGIAMAMAALATTTTACSSPGDGLTRVRAVVDGENTLSIWNDGVTTRGVVVYFHGLDRDETILEMDESHRELIRRLTDAGYAVVASRAGGNAYGNTESQNDYAELTVTAAAHHRVSDVFFLAESMGTVAAVNLMARRPDLRPRGLAAIGPALNLGAVGDDYRTGLLGANPDVTETDPMRLPAESLAGQSFRFYVSPDDVLVPTASNADAFRARFGSVADVSIVECSGQHLNSSCVNGEDVASWFSVIAPW